MGKSIGNCKAVGELLSLAGDGDVGMVWGAHCLFALRSIVVACICT